MNCSAEWGRTCIMRGLSGNALDHDDKHFMLGVYGRKDQIDNTIEDLKTKGRDSPYGVSVREFRMFEVTTHPENEENLRELLTELHEPGYFKRAFGNAVDKILRLAPPIDSFNPAPHSADVETHGVRAYVVGEHDQSADNEPLDGKETLSIDDVEVTN